MSHPFVAQVRGARENDAEVAELRAEVAGVAALRGEVAELRRAGAGAAEDRGLADEVRALRAELLELRAAPPAPPSAPGDDDDVGGPRCDVNGLPGRAAPGHEPSRRPAPAAPASPPRRHRLSRPPPNASYHSLPPPPPRHFPNTTGEHSAWVDRQLRSPESPRRAPPRSFPRDARDPRAADGPR